LYIFLRWDNIFFCEPPVYSPEYLTNVSELIKEKLTTIEGKNMLNNYLMWQIIR
jgi:hypothetical protein